MADTRFSQRREPEGVDGTFRPQLTSLIDVMTILLVFLIKSFSVEGNLVTPSPDLMLPLSSATEPPRPVCTIEITRDAVVVEGDVIARIDDFVPSDSLLVPLLHDYMLVQRAKCPDTAGTMEALIQSDREVPFDVIKRVMFTCSKAGFSDFLVLVLEEEG